MGKGRTDRIALALLGAGVAMHVVLALAFHLSPDETHYALYSVHPDWSYFDHPPMSGWLQWPFGALASALGHVGIWPDVVMRVLPMTCWAMAAVWMAQLATHLYPGVRHIRRFVLALWVVSPIAHLLGLALVPDSILMPILCVVMALCWRLCSQDGVHALRWWLALGVALGLAGLSKYTAIFIGLGAILVLLSAHGLALLRQPGAWLALVVAAVLITPVIGWNMANEWISLVYQANHAKGTEAWQLQRVVAFALVQVLGYGALLLVGALAALRAASPAQVRTAGSHDALAGALLSPQRFCLCFGLPPLLALLYLSGRGSTLPHWSVTAWLAMLPMAAAGCAGWWAKTPVSGSAKTVASLSVRQRVLAGLFAFQLLCCLGLFGLMLAGGVQQEKGTEARSLPGQVPATAQFNPFADLYGWDAAARRASVLANQHRSAQSGGQQPVPLAVMNWTLASRIAWYANRPTFVVQRHLDQFALWWGVLQPGDDALVVDWSQMSFEAPVQQPGGPPGFAQCELLEQWPVIRWGRQLAHFNLQLCRNWQGPKETARDRIRN